MTKSSLSRSAAVGDAAGDADRRRGIAYYNYQSLPVPSSGIDGLLKFVTSQLSLTILSLFFCCDLSTTPADVIDHVEKMPNCSILNIRMNDDFEMEISKPILQMGSHDPGQLILITDEGNFEALAKRLPGWNLTVFHSSDMDPTFFDYASRAIELPVIAEPEPAVTFEEEMEKPAAANWKPEKIKLNLAGSIMDLADVNKSLRTILEQLLVNNHQKMEKPAAEIKTISYGVESKKVEEEDIFSKSDEPSANDESEVSRDEFPSTFRGNEWDDFPKPDASPLGQSGWDEVDKKLEREEKLREPVNPFAQVRKNPFGGGGGGGSVSSFDGSNCLSVSASSMAPAAIPPSPYNQDLYDNRALFRVDNVCNGFALKGGLFEKPQSKGRGFAKMHSGQEIHPQLVPPVMWKKDSAQQQQPKTNPFAAGPQPSPGGGGGRGGGQKPLFTRPKQQCPQWEDPAHRLDTACPMYHPIKRCLFFPNCRQPAADCIYAHPFCTDGDCHCDEAVSRDPRLNHYTAGGSRRKE